MHASPDPALIAAALRGDDRAFRQFYDRHVDAVFGRAMSLLRDEEDAKEVTQETFGLAYRKLRTLRLVDGSAKPWLLRSCTNIVYTRMRSARRRPNMVQPTEFDTTISETELVDSRLESELVLGKIRKELLQMPFLDQQVFRLVVVDERSYDEAAQALSISTASVRKRLNRIRLKLRAGSARRTDD